MKLLLPILSVLFGLVFFVFGSKFYISMSNFKKNAVKTTGKVTGVTTNKTKTGGLDYSPVILFKTDSGQEIKYTADRYRNEPYTIGQDIDVLYNSVNPNQAFLDTPMNVFGGPYLLLIIGIISIAVGIYFLLQKKI